jgi:RLL motif-containing protein 1
VKKSISMSMSSDASLRRRMTALGVPDDASLVAYLEDRFIRQLDEAARAPLRQQEPGALREYLTELGASTELLAECEAHGESARVRSWLINVALHFEYADKQEEHEAAARAAQAAQPLISADDPELLNLCAALGVSPAATATESLQTVVKAARQLPRPAPPPALPAKRAAPEPSPLSRAAPPRQRAPLARGDEAFPLGFETGSARLDEVARVLRMLHVRELRKLQDEVNRAIVKLQEFTANPRTDSRLGRVGR